MSARWIERVRDVSDTELLPKSKPELAFAPIAPRLEQIGDKCSKQVDNRKHRIG